MSEPARNRFALDLDDLERQLRGAAQPAKPGSNVDPLVELTRIVGQDDPLKDLFAPRQGETQRSSQPQAQAPGSWQQDRIEPTFQPQVVPLPRASSQAAPAAQPPAELRGALDEFEALLRRTEPARQDEPQPVAVPQRHAYVPESQSGAAAYDDRDLYAQPQPAYQDTLHQPRDLDEDARHGYQAGYESSAAQDHDYAAAHYQPEDEAPAHQPPRSRKGLLTAAALLGVAVVGIGVALAVRGGRSSDSGQPPTITADTGPTKIAPENPGGAEIPNQNKQIYERSADTSAAGTKVVTREEQPVDVQQAARAMQPRVVLPGPGTGTATAPDASPNAQPAGVAAGADPGLVAMPAVPGLGEPRRVRTVTIRPDGAPVPPAGTSEMTSGIVTGSAPPARAPAPQPAARPAPAQSAATPAPVATTPPAAPPTRVAAVAPAQPVTPAPAAPRTDAAGGFVVQLAAPGSESEARATFAALQRKYPDQLAGQSPIIRKTDLSGGKTVYRLRVGPYSREDATSMCSRLQAAGGQCFIAKN